VGSCPNEAIGISDILGQCLPELVGECKECGICVSVCPGKEVNFKELVKRNERMITSYYIGRFHQIYIGHANNKGVWHRGASGGMVTAILLQLLEEDKIDGTVLLDFSEDMPWFPEVKVSSNPTEIVRAAQSKYFIYPHNIILKKIRESRYSKVAYVGLPCQIHGLRKATEKRVPGTEKIKYIMGLYCGNNLYYKATLDLYKKLGFKDTNLISRVAYRDGNYPGKFVVEGKNGKIGMIDKFTFNYLSFFFIPFRCLFCIDLTSELADISFGDGWQDTYQERGKIGQSVIIVRHDGLLPVMENGIHKGNYELKKVTKKKALLMHSNVLDNKKVGSFIRMEIIKKRGGLVPSYNIPNPYYSIKRSFMEYLNLIIIQMGASKIARTIIRNYIPLFILKKIMLVTRRKWREKTKKFF